MLMFYMDKENKLSAYWVLEAIKYNMKSNLLFGLAIVLMEISTLITFIRMNIIDILSAVMILYVVYVVFYMLNMVAVLSGNEDLREFHAAQDDVYFIVGFTDEEEIMLSAFVSGFEAKVLFIMKENGWLHIHDKTIVKLDIYNYGKKGLY